MKESINHFLAQQARVRPNGPGRRGDDPWAPLLLPVSWYMARKGPVRKDANQAGDGEAVYWALAARHVIARHALDKAAEGLAQAGIPVILLKGMAFAETLYPSTGLRHAADVDLLVRPADLGAATDTLIRMGWSMREEGRASPELNQWPGRDMGQVGELHFFNQRGTVLEIHWHLVPYVWQRRIYSVDMDAVWAEASPLGLPGLGHAMGLSPMHTLAYLCLHQALHGLGHVKGYLDADLFVRKVWGGEQGPWDAFVACARAWRIRAAAFHVLRLTRFLFGTPVPEQALELLDPGPVSRAVVSSLVPCRALLSGEGALGRRYPNLVRMALVDRWLDLAGLVLRLLFPSAVWRMYRYGGDASLRTHWQHMIKRAGG